MTKNSIQFQKGISLPEFIAQYGTEKQCIQAAFELRWPEGFECPKCGNKTYCELHGRKVLQCHHCHHQPSVTAGTIFHSSKLPLTTWFLAMYLISQSKNGISALELGRQIGVSYNASWRLKHKLMQVMLERGSTKKLSGRVEIDDSYLGAKRVPGKRGRGAKGKTPFVAAVETRDEKPVRVKLSRVLGFRRTEIERWSEHHLAQGTTVVSDGLDCFNAVNNTGCHHEVHVVSGAKKPAEHQAFKWVNTVLGNVKNALRGTYHSISKKHIPRYLAEFQYRINRRFNLKDIFLRLAYMAFRTPAMPVALLTLAEKEW